MSCRSKSRIGTIPQPSGCTGPSGGWQVEARLPAVIRGNEKPKDAIKGIEFAEVAFKTKQFGTSARLFAETLLADPKLAENLETGHRYNATFTAALAEHGQGQRSPSHSTNARKPGGGSRLWPGCGPT